MIDLDKREREIVDRALTLYKAQLVAQSDMLHMYRAEEDLVITITWECDAIEKIQERLA